MLATHVLLFLLTFVLALAVMLKLQPKENSMHNDLTGTGIAYYIRYGENVCFHIHHYILCFVFLIVLVAGVYASQGSWTLMLTAIVGILVGIAASDAVYSDLTLRRACVICEQPKSMTEWKSCKSTCSGT